MRRELRWAGAVLALAATAEAALGQEGDREGSPLRSPWITEAAYGYAARGACANHYPSFELGRVIPLADPVSVGVSGFLGHNEDLVLGPRARLRYQTSSSVALDAVAGVVWGGSGARPNAEIAIGYRDTAFLFTRYERYGDGGCGQEVENQIFLGVKVGSRPGVWTAVVGGGIAAVVIFVVTRGIEN